VQALQLLLLPHAEAVLLVDDDEPEVLELDIGLQQLVRADDQVEAAFGEAGKCGLNLLRAAKAREFRHASGRIREAVGERLEMLLGKERRGHQQCDLLAICNGHPGRAERHFGFAEADVAANEPVHRASRRHVADHRLDRCSLVAGLFEAEAFGKRFVVVRIEAERVALARGALRIEVEEFGRRVVRLLRRLLLGLVPLPAAQLMQWCGVRRSTAVTADQMQARDWDVELRVVGVLELEEFVRAVAQVQRHQS